MANNTAIGAKEMHMLLNRRNRLTAYWCRIHEMIGNRNGFYSRNRYGKENNTEIQGCCNTELRR